MGTKAMNIKTADRIHMLFANESFDFAVWLVDTLSKWNGPEPHIYPNADPNFDSPSGVSIEWDIPHGEINIEILIKSHIGTIQLWTRPGWDLAFERNCDMDKPESWAVVASLFNHNADAGKMV